jgi:hypothetical protein
MATGAIALERLQAGLEATRGTAVPATRRVYGERGTAFFDPTVTKEFLAESMSSYIKNYRHVVTGVAANLTIPGWVTPSDLAWWGQSYWKGGVTGVLSAVTVYTYTFSPTVGTDDLKTPTFEAQTDTQGWQLPFCLGEKLEISWQAGQAVKFSADLMAQQAIPQAVTAAIGDRTGLNGLAGTTANVYIDAGGGTIGTTPAANVLGGKFTWTNQWMPITHNKGQLFYDDAVREVRSLAIELDVHYNSQTELATVQSDVERLIRVNFQGPVIAGSTGSIKEAVNMDFYGFHLDAAFSPNKAIRAVKLVGESQYDTTAGFDWAVACITSNATLV